MTILCFPDALHAYFGVCGLALMGEPGIQPMNAALNISQRAAQHLKDIHDTWHRQAGEESTTPVANGHINSALSGHTENSSFNNNKHLNHSASIDFVATRSNKNLLFHGDRHVRFFLKCLQGFPDTHSIMDSSR